MKSRPTYNGYMTLKIELPPTGISRTITVPGNMTLADLNDAIQSIMGWEDDHLWSFQDRGRDGTLYELPRDKDGLKDMGSRLVLDASEIQLEKVLPDRGSKLFYEYDFGDGWKHVIKRLADPKNAEIACVKSVGPDGIEDFGGPYHLSGFLEHLRTNPLGDDWIDSCRWVGISSEEEAKKYLEGESASQKTAKLKAALSHVPEPEPPKTDMSDQALALALAPVFAMTLDAQSWTILERAIQNGGSCKFDDPYRRFGRLFMTMLNGVKIKDGGGSAWLNLPSTLTVPKKWVEWYTTHGDTWRKFRKPYDDMEFYANSATRLYGVVSLKELHDIMLRYDPDFSYPVEDWKRFLMARALHTPHPQFWISGELVVSQDVFPQNVDNVKNDIKDFRAKQAQYPRWHPASKADLFVWNTYGNFAKTHESDDFEFTLRSLCRLKSEQEVMRAINTIYDMLSDPMRPVEIVKTLERHMILPKLTHKPQKILFEAMLKWGATLHLRQYNGNTQQVKG